MLTEWFMLISNVSERPRLKVLVLSSEDAREKKHQADIRSSSPRSLRYGWKRTPEGQVEQEGTSKHMQEQRQRDQRKIRRQGSLQTREVDAPSSWEWMGV